MNTAAEAARVLLAANRPNGRHEPSDIARSALRAIAASRSLLATTVFAIYGAAASVTSQRRMLGPRGEFPVTEFAWADDLTSRLVASDALSEEAVNDRRVVTAIASGLEPVVFGTGGRPSDDLVALLVRAPDTDLGAATLRQALSDIRSADTRDAAHNRALEALQQVPEDPGSEAHMVARNALSQVANADTLLGAMLTALYGKARANAATVIRPMWAEPTFPEAEAGFTPEDANNPAIARAIAAAAEWHVVVTSGDTRQLPLQLLALDATMRTSVEGMRRRLDEAAASASLSQRAFDTLASVGMDLVMSSWRIAHRTRNALDMSRAVGIAAFRAAVTVVREFVHPTTPHLPGE